MASRIRPDLLSVAAAAGDLSRLEVYLVFYAGVGREFVIDFAILGSHGPGSKGSSTERSF